MGRCSGLSAWLLVFLLVGCSGRSTEPGGEPDGRLDLSRGDSATVDAGDSEESPADIAPDRTDVEAPVEHAGVTSYREGDNVVLENAFVRVEVHLDSGTWDVASKVSDIRVLGAQAHLVLDDGTLPGVGVGTGGASGSAFAEPISDALGEGVQVVATYPVGEFSFEVTLGLRGDNSFLLAEARYGRPAEAASEERVRDFSPMLAGPTTGGGLFVGTDPWQHVVLDNGSDMYFDFAARVFRVGQGDSLFLPPGSVSNWDMALVDSASDRAVVAGFMTHDVGMGLIRLHHDPNNAPTLDGRSGFARFEGFARYEPSRPMPVAEEGTLSTLRSEVFYLDLAPESGQAGLEAWARNFATYHGRTVWADIPTSWNSWTGGSKSGGLSSDINEAIVQENFQLMLEDFKPLGMQYFLIDDGWQLDHGDWETNPDDFPPHDGLDGLAWLAQQIQAEGLIPGIWIAPFWVKKSAQLYADHPDWFAPVNEMGGFVVNEEKDAVLDLTHPAVLEYLHELFTRITQEWGYKWIKMDFAYYALFTYDLHDPTVTASEAFRHALMVIRDAIGPETFLLSVSALGLCMDIADGSRLTLDNAPIWGDGLEHSIKTTLLTAAHRYYLSHGWVTHPDLLFFRSEPYGLGLEEARTWATFVSLYGGIVKLGETFVDLHANPEWMAIARRLFPASNQGARPLDLFERRYPERWVLQAHRDDREWAVAGLFNWGENVIVATGAELAEAPREMTLSWAELGLADGVAALFYDGWSGNCAWHDGPTWSTTVAPRRVALQVVLADSQVPRVIATDRHLLGGLVEIANEKTTTTDDGLVLSFNLVNAPAMDTAIAILADAEPSLLVAPELATVEPGPCERVWLVRVAAGDVVEPMEILVAP